MKSGKKIFIYPFISTNDTKLQWLQYRINHYILTTNVYAKKIGITNSDVCSFCKEEKETIIHILWECHKVNFIINSLEQILQRFHIN